MRLLWIVPDFPRRGVSAARERFWALLSRLAARHEVHALVVADATDVGREAELPPGLARVHVVRRRVIPADDPLSILPSVVRWGYGDPALVAAVNAALHSAAFDVVQFEFVESGIFMPEPRVPTVLTVHQLGFAAWRARWRADGRSFRAAPIALYRHLRDLDFELRAVRRAHHVVTMSSEDAARLRRFLPRLPVSVSPVGVDCASFRPEGRPPEIDLLFVGHFHHPPNVDAARFLVRDVLPRLGRPVRVRIVGHDAPAEIAGAGVEVIGAVSDVRPHLAAARVVVAPVRFGTGMRGKVLEALAMGRPLVTTRLGAEGLDATPGVHLLVADGAADFAAAIARVLADPSLAERLGREGRRLVETRFDWARIAEEHERIYEAVVRAPAPPRTAPPGAPTALAAAARRAGWWPGALAGAILLGARGAARYARAALHAG